ncbi:MAG: HAD family hydrolase [Candidatus Marinimicrobia bacterium]|nr:HAD family hydrolase [Candidatus Neomarinimicrobiota bacterium]
MDIKKIKVIGFDADDTLWINEPHYQKTEASFCRLLSDFLPQKELSEALFKTEMQNLALYGYGGKSFLLSMIETAQRISKNRVDNQTLAQIIVLGKTLLDQPVDLLDGVKETLEKLGSRDVDLIVATKGDLLDQERKLAKSELKHYFHHIEIMSDKKQQNYEALLAHLEITPENFLMIGNSLKSDILPVVELGGHAIHIPYHTTWAHEHVEAVPDSPYYQKMTIISDVLDLFEL